MKAGRPSTLAAIPAGRRQQAQVATSAASAAAVAVAIAARGESVGDSDGDELNFDAVPYEGPDGSV